MRPPLSAIPEFYHRYVNLVAEENVREAFSNHTMIFLEFLSSIPEVKFDYRYAPGKWSVREVLQHIVDAERVFSYRALVFARKDTTSLPGFDENEYADNSFASSRDWNDLVEEFTHLRRASEKMFASFNEEQLNATGTANNNVISVKAIGYVVLGHAMHHMNVIREKYGN